MRNIYENNPMNAPRLKTDTHFVDYSSEYRHTGFIDKAYRFIEEFQLLSPEMWMRFVNQFREEDADFEGGWRGEYWGKCMRGGAFVYQYTKNPELYRVLRSTVIDMIDSARENEGGTVLITGHAMAIRALTCGWLGMPYEQMQDVPWVGNASVTVVDYDTANNTTKLVVLGENSFQGDMATTVLPFDKPK